MPQLFKDYTSARGATLSVSAIFVNMDLLQNRRILCPQEQMFSFQKYSFTEGACKTEKSKGSH